MGEITITWATNYPSKTQLSHLPVHTTYNKQQQQIWYSVVDSPCLQCLPLAYACPRAQPQKPLASPSYSITPFADLARRRSRTVCQQEFVLEPTLLISLLCLLATVSCWELEMRPLLPFTSLFTNQMISLENFRRQRVRSFLTTSPTGTPLTSRCSQRSRTRQMQASCCHGNEPY